jgi:KDO2-lipid IV(A) lauroyltransferase
VTAHFGNWELGGAVLAALGYPLHAVVLPHPNSRVEALFQQRRESRGLRVMPLGAAGRHSIRALRHGEFVCVLADRDYTPHARSVPFFGVPARFPLGPVRLAVATGAPLVAGFSLRQDDETHLLRFHPPLIPDGPNSAPDLQRRLCAIVEREVAAAPCQWFMFDDFWANGGAHAEGRA